MRDQPTLRPACAKASGARPGGAAAHGRCFQQLRLPERRDPGWHLTSLPGEREGPAKAHPLPALTGAPQSESKTKKKNQPKPKSNRGFGVVFASSPKCCGFKQSHDPEESNEADLREKKQAVPHCCWLVCKIGLNSTGHSEG